MQCETCHGTGQTPDPVVPKCGWCRDIGMAPWIMGDYLHTCNLCDAGKQMAALGWGRNPFASDLTREFAESVLGALTNEEYQRILEDYNQRNGII